MPTRMTPTKHGTSTFTDVKEPVLPISARP